MKLSKSLTLSAMSFALFSNSHLVSADAFYDALSSGKVSLDSRLRYETADTDGDATDKAKGLTLRTRLGYKTAELGKVSAFIEFEDTRIVAGIDEYSPFDTSYDTIADPEATELNQGYLLYKPTESLSVIAGRQRLILDNARFVGNVGWRQNEQTFDALTAKYAQGDFAATVSWIDQVGGIIDKFDAVTDDALVNLSYKTPAGKVVVYYYDLDHSNTHNQVQFENDTTGISFDGSSEVSEGVKLSYRLEFAAQETSTDKEADYSAVELSLAFKPVTLAVGMETLGSDDGTYGFQTPLATKHAFNGWADMFLVTPADGLEDTYMKAVTKITGIKFVAVYHEFAGDDSGDDIGTEMDLLAVKAFGKKYQIGLKYASFSTEEDYGLSDKDVMWAWGQVTF